VTRLLPLILFALSLPMAAKEVTVTLTITGMSTGYDAAAVKDSLENVKGVKVAKVSVDHEEAVVTYDDAVVKTETLIQAVKRTESEKTFDAKEKK
jgi:copper chaperone CopZ